MDKKLEEKIAKMKSTSIWQNGTVNAIAWATSLTATYAVTNLMKYGFKKATPDLYNDWHQSSIPDYLDKAAFAINAFYSGCAGFATIVTHFSDKDGDDLFSNDFLMKSTVSALSAYGVYTHNLGVINSFITTIVGIRLGSDISDALIEEQETIKKYEAANPNSINNLGVNSDDAEYIQ